MRNYNKPSEMPNQKPKTVFFEKSKKSERRGKNLRPLCPAWPLSPMSCLMLYHLPRNSEPTWPSSTRAASAGPSSQARSACTSEPRAPTSGPNSRCSTEKATIRTRKAQALQKPYHDLLFTVHQMIIRFNQWSGCKVDVPFIQLTTLNKHCDAQEVTIARCDAANIRMQTHEVARASSQQESPQ